jgi:hypothetical protein
MALSMQEKQHVGKEVALRYLRARKKEKGIMLQEFCATTGYSPPYAAYLLRMGSATMDRLLREEKTRGGNRRHAPRACWFNAKGVLPGQNQGAS